MSDYFAYINIPDLPYNFTLQDAMDFLDATEQYIYCASEAGADPRVLMEQRKKAYDLIHCHYVWALP
jgi:hypothetical protein